MLRKMPCLLISGAAAVLVAHGAARAEGPAPAAARGDRWEVTSKMSMEGMPMAMPARSVKICSAKEWKEPPGAADERRKCTTSDFRWEGNKATWKTVCAGPPAMTGDGQLTRESPDAFSGVIRFASSDGVMTINLTGRRIGDCENPQ